MVDEIIYFGSSLRLYTYFEQSKEPVFFDITADTDLATRGKKWHRLTVGWPTDFALCYPMHETTISRGKKTKRRPTHQLRWKEVPQDKRRSSKKGMGHYVIKLLGD